MNGSPQNPFSHPVTVFRDRRLPEPAIPVGYAALIEQYELNPPLPCNLAAIHERHRITEARGWRLYTPRHMPREGVEGHLTFALKYEGVDLIVLKQCFQALGPKPIEQMVRATPTGAYVRRLWFFYEWLLGERLDLPDATTGNYVEAIDSQQQWAAASTSSPRHRVKNNLPGTPAFCPLVRRTPALDAFVRQDLSARAHDVVAKVPKDVLSRTAAFLLLKDSKSSYAIEGERPPQDRIQRWGRAIGEAGRQPLDINEFLRLQRIVIGDDRFVHLGLRHEGGFVGEHDRETGMPLPDHISAKAEDLPDLMAGLIAFDHGAARDLDPVIAAATLAFGFVYIHPFEDGNGRIHRYLIHHALAARGLSPVGVVFPVSSAILDRIEDYRRVLESYSARLLPVVRWEPTAEGNVRVLNDTADFYRYFDATPHAEFLFECVARTIDHDLPAEAAFLRRFDEFSAVIQAMVDMPARRVDLLFRFLQQGAGRLSARGRQREFEALTDKEVAEAEAAYARLFKGQDGDGQP